MYKIKSFFTQTNTLLLLVIFLHGVINVVWHSVNTAPPTWDSAGHLGLSFLFSDRLLDVIAGRVSINEFLRISNYYPPLVQFLGGLAVTFFGRNYYYPLMIGTIFFLISFVYLYRIIVYYFKDENLAAYTVFIYGLFPHMWEQSRQFHLDVPLVCLILISYFYLIKSDALRDKKNSLLFFIFFTLSQLTKWYGFIFLVVPFIYEVVGKVRLEKDYVNLTRFKNIAIGIVLILIFALPWYVANYHNIANIVSVTSTGELGDPENVLSLESLFHYIKLIMSHQITFIPLVLVFFAMYKMEKSQVSFRKKMFYMTLFPYFIFSLIQNKDLRYLLPLTPIFAFYISYLILKINFKFSKFLKFFLPVYLMFLMFFMSFNQYKRLPDKFKFLAYAIGGPYYHGWYYEPYFYAANTENWKGPVIIDAINSLAVEEPFIKGNYKVLELSDNRYYSLASFEMFRRQAKYDNMEIVVPYFQFEPFTPDALTSYLADIQFALVPGDPGPIGLRNIAVLNQLSNFFTSNLNTEFTLMNVYELPDGNKLSLYKRSNYINFRDPGVREDSLKVYVGNILMVDREKTGGLPFDINLVDFSGQEKTIHVEGGGSRRRVSLNDIRTFNITLPTDQHDIKDIRGWYFEEGVFKRDPHYAEVMTESGGEYVYENMRVVPRSKHFTLKFRPKSLVSYSDGAINISVESPREENEKVFVAYATEGWVWNNIWLEGENRQLSIPTEGLIQIEVSQASQHIVGFPENWGFFSCYEGKAVCYYPLVEGL